jgi:hypothetical protein
MTEAPKKPHSLTPSPGGIAAVSAGFVVMTFAPAAALAYVGPGAGLGILGVLLATVVAVLASLVGLVLWPLRMLARRRKSASTKVGDVGSEAKLK